MADEVEITNVGGDNGVASEATLASLTRAIERLAASTGKDPKKEAAKVQKMHTRTLQEDIKAIEDAIDAEEEKTKTLKKATDAVNRFSRATIGAVAGLLGSLTGSVLNLTNAVLDGGSSITDFAQHLPLVGSSLSVFTQVIDQNIEAVRSMSQIGATFGNGLTEIRHIAANAAIPLSDFVDLVQQNSESMKLFGNSTAIGARNFAAISKELRQGPGRALMNLGFTSSELNELLIDYAEIQNIAFTRDRIQGRITAANAAAFGEELLRITAITGKRREQIEAELRQQSSDIRVRAALGRMDQDQRERFQLNVADISTESQALGNALVDFSDGIPTDETTRRLMQYSDTFRIFGQDIQNMDPGQFNNFVVGVRQDLEDYADSIGRPLEEVMNSVPGLADAFGIIGETARRQELTPEQIADMERRAALERRNGESLMQFNETMNTIRGELMSAFIESGVLGLVENSLSTLAGTISDFVRSPAFSEGLERLATTINNFIKNVTNFGFSTALFGGTETVDTPSGPQTVEIQGLFKNLFGEGGVISSAFASVTPQLTNMFTDVLGSAFSFIGEGISNWFSDNWMLLLAGALAGVAAVIAAPFIGLFGGIVAGIAYIIGGTMLIDGIENAWNSISETFTNIGEWWSNLSFTNMISSTWESITGVFSGIGEWWSNLSFTDMISNAWANISGFFSIDSEFSISGLISNAWNSVTSFFSFGDTSFSISQLATDAWNNVTNWFGMDGLDFSISALGTVAWEAVKSWFSFGTDTMFSIAQLAIDAWANVISWFEFGDGEGFSISQLATDAWETVTSFFSFGDSEFSISSLISNAWETVTGFFSLDNFEIPSISNLFQGIIDRVRGFFSFDFELPNFKEFLPTWLGGSGRSLSDTESISATTIDPAAIESASATGNALVETQNVLSTFAALPDLQNNLDILNAGLDVDSVRQYNRAMEQLVETLEELNEVLAEDNRGILGGGTGVAAANVIQNMNTASTGSSEGIDRLNRTMSQVLTVMQAMAEDADGIERNTRSMGGNIANGRISAIR